MPAFEGWAKRSAGLDLEGRGPEHLAAEDDADHPALPDQRLGDAPAARPAHRHLHLAGGIAQEIDLALLEQAGREDRLQRGQRALERRLELRADGHLSDPARARRVEADQRRLAAGRAHPVEARAPAPVVRRHRRLDRLELHAVGDRTAQSRGHAGLLGGGLHRVGHVLPGAAAAGAIAEQRTGRLDPIGRGSDDGDESAAGELLVLLDQADPHLLAGRGAGNEHDQTVGTAADRVATGRQLVDLDLELELAPGGHAGSTSISIAVPREAPSSSAALPSRTAISTVPREPR